MAERLSAVPKGWKFNAGLAAAALEAISAVALLATSAYLISRASEQPPILYLMMAVVGVRAFALGRAAFRYLQRLMLHDAVFTHLAKLRPVLFERLVQLSPTGFSGARGERLSRLTTDVDELQNLGIRIIGPMLQAGTALVISFFILLPWFPETAVLVALASLSSLMLIFVLTLLASRRGEQNRSALRSELRSTLVEYLENSELLVSLGWNQRYRARIAQLEGSIRSAERLSALASGLAASLTGVLAIVVVVGGSWLAPLALERGAAGNLLAIAVLLPLAIFDVFSGFQNAANSLIRYRSSKSRLDDLMTQSVGAELCVPSGPGNLASLTSLRFEDAELRLAKTLVHQNLNLEFTAGKLVAIVGPSGSGKSTIGLAAASLISPTAGQLRFDSVPAEELSVESKRSQVVLIEQDPHIFAGTVRQNLEISGVRDEKLLNQALDEVGLREEFQSRGGLDAEVSESAGNISGGQAQRLAIARGLLAKASFLILDEPTSGLDWDNATSLLSLLRGLATGGKGIVVITHDPALAELCDQTIRLG